MRRIDLPFGFELQVDGLHLNVAKPEAGHQPFRGSREEGGLPARVQVITGRGEDRERVLLREKDFTPAEAEVTGGGGGIRLTGRHRGLVFSQEVKWEEVTMGERRGLMLSRRVVLGIESVEFTAPDHVRLFAMTRWGDLGEGRSYELSTHMGWHLGSAGQWGYRAWVTPCMFDADGPGTDQNYRPSSVHNMGMAEYTAVSWPEARRAVAHVAVSARAPVRERAILPVRFAPLQGGERI